MFNFIFLKNKEWIKKIQIASWSISMEEKGYDKNDEMYVKVEIKPNESRMVLFLYPSRKNKVIPL